MEQQHRQLQQQQQPEQQAEHQQLQQQQVSIANEGIILAHAQQLQDEATVSQVGVSGATVPQELSIHSLSMEESHFIHQLTQQFHEGVISQPPVFECPTVPVAESPYHQVTVNLPGYQYGIVGRGGSKEAAAKDAVTKITTALSTEGKAQGQSGALLHIVRYLF